MRYNVLFDFMSLYFYSGIGMPMKILYVIMGIEKHLTIVSLGKFPLPRTFQSMKKFSTSKEYKSTDKKEDVIRTSLNQTLKQRIYLNNIRKEF